MIRSVQKQHQAGREQEKADQVEPFGSLLFVVIIGEKQGRKYDRQDTDRQIDEEKPMPGRVLEMAPAMTGPRIGPNRTGTAA
jgi:hypothetical protein